MSATLLLSLLGIGLLITTVSGFDDEETTDEELAVQPEIDDQPSPQEQEPQDDTPSEPVATAFDAPDPEGRTFGTDGNDIFDHSNNDSDRYYQLLDGADNVDAGSGNDTITATGNTVDFIDGGGGDDLIVGDDGRGRLEGGAGDDTISTGNGGMSISDTEGANLIRGGDGNDGITFSSQSTVTGGDGNDLFNITASTGSEAPGIVTDFNPDEDRIGRITFAAKADEELLRFETLDDGSGVGMYSGDELLTSFIGATEEDFEGEEGESPIFRTFVNGGTMTGTDQNDTFSASDLAETIFGGDGDDYISGGINRDTGPDLLDGGDGNDTIVARGASLTEYFNPEDLDAELSTILEPNLMLGGAGDDVLVSTYNNTMTGGEGEDSFGIDRWYPQDAISREGAAPLITDFDPDEDVIYIDQYNSLRPEDTRSVPEDMTIEVWEDGAGADVVFGDLVIARVAGGQDLTVGDIVVPERGVSAALLGFQ